MVPGTGLFRRCVLFFFFPGLSTCKCQPFPIYPHHFPPRYQQLIPRNLCFDYVFCLPAAAGFGTVMSTQRGFDLTAFRKGQSAEAMKEGVFEPSLDGQKRVSVDWVRGAAR